MGRADEKAHIEHPAAELYRRSRLHDTQVLDFWLENEQLYYRGIWKLLDLPPEASLKKGGRQLYIHFCAEEKDLDGMTLGRDAAKLKQLLLKELKRTSFARKEYSNEYYKVYRLSEIATLVRNSP